MYILIYIQIKRFYSAKENDVVIELEVGWIPEPACTFKRAEILLTLIGIESITI